MSKSSGMQRISDRGNYESLVARNTVTLVGAILVSVGLNVVQGLLLVGTNADLTYALNNKVMYGFPDENGVYISADKRPVGAIKRLAESVVFNQYGYDVESASINFREVASHINPRLAPTYAKNLNDRIKKIKRQSLSSQFDRRGLGRIQEVKGGYVYTLSGVQSIYASRTFVEAHELTIQVTLKTDVPTTARPIGVWVESIKEVKKRKVQL